VAVNNMSVGKDYTLVFVDGNTNAPVEFGDVQSFTITAQKHDIKSMPYNDVPRYGYIPDGYKITFSITRVNSGLEDFQLAANTRFNEGSHERAGYLNETVKNPDGTVSRYQYTGFVFWLTDIGDVSREKNVNMKAEGWASDKVKIA
jgi:hypothetical protein